MQISVRKYQGMGYTNSVGEITMDCGNYEITPAHAWKLAAYNIVSKENRKLCYSVGPNGIYEAKQNRAVPLKSTKDRIEFRYGRAHIGLRLASKHGFVFIRERWTLWRDYRQIGEFTFKLPLMSLYANINDDCVETILFAGAMLWTNRDSYYHPGDG